MLLWDRQVYAPGFVFSLNTIHSDHNSAISQTKKRKRRYSKPNNGFRPTRAWKNSRRVDFDHRLPHSIPRFLDSLSHSLHIILQRIRLLGPPRRRRWSPILPHHGIGTRRTMPRRKNFRFGIQRFRDIDPSRLDIVSRPRASKELRCDMFVDGVWNQYLSIDYDNVVGGYVDW